MDAASGRELLDDGARAAARVGDARAIVTIAAVNGARVRRRLRAGDGLRRAPRRAARRPSASPRSTSGSSPASAAPSGCRGWSGAAKALEMNLDRRRRSRAEEALRVRPRQPRRAPTTSCSTPRWRGRASSPARRRWRSSRSSGCRATGDLDDGHRGREATASRTVVRLRGRARGHRRLPREAHAASSRASEPTRADGSRSPS